MALKYYVIYSAAVDESTGARSSVLRLYTAEIGAPPTGGTLAASFAGTGPALSGAETDGTFRPNETSWTETMSADGGGQLEVSVAGAGTPAAAISFVYGGEEMRFDASSLVFTPSTNHAPACSYNKDGAPAERIAGYTSAVVSATALGADSVSVEGTLDPAAESYALRWRTDAAPNDDDRIALTGPAESVFPVVVTGLVPETTYRFEIVSAGARGESVSAAVSATTPAAPQLAVPTFEIFDADAAGVKRAEIADVAGAAYFELQIAAGDGFSGAETLRVTNSGGARVFLRDWPESESGTYSVRVRAASGSNAYSDSAWSEAAAVEIGPGEGGDAESAAEMAVYSNLAIYAAPSAPYHAATVSKVSELISGAVGAVVNTVGGLSGTVTCAQLASAAAEEGVLVVHSTGAAPNPNNTPVITASSTDAQVPSAKAVYYYVQNVRGRLAASLAEHQHTYLCAWGSERIVAAPALDEDGTIVPDAALAPAFDADETYLPDAVVASEGYLYRNTSGTASTGNADFARKWTKTTAAELIARAAQSAGGRYTADFFGADLDEERSIEITHNLGERYVSVELIDMTAGAGAPVIGALVSLTSDDALKLTFSEGLPAAGRYKAVVRV